MKPVQLLLVAIFTCTLGLSAISSDVYAASNAKEGTISTNTAKINQARPGGKSVSKKKKEIPYDVNINTADKSLLIRLPGIGPATAKSIIQYREANGEFKSIDELTKVKGIGSKTLAKLKPYLYQL
ncbi:MAG: helix-hairpin-helix domain-containing protein [Desulforhopalus sp.]